VREDGRIVSGEEWQEKSTQQTGMEEAAENGKESSYSAHASGMNESINQPLHVLGAFTAHNQAVCTVYVQQLVGITCLSDWQLVSSAASHLNV
jgi:hypothetical protein